MAVTRDQFRIRDDLTVEHLPSGLVISTYRYKDPSQVGDLTIRKAQFGADDLSPKEEQEVRQAALGILRDLQAKSR
ncbi:hypothetical protein CN151_10705 [Sinorhizobium meliloti]|uniref:hypothetical protein n=1 Tax=Rhizobium meliloti TaxID=382 RepID=UPI000FD5A440|nr:hypothetical protein [Sinorhizobium meliloti]RVL05107.1 hypothetical protein CN151_10705 [Sinorhizobium meliloti]